MNKIQKAIIAGLAVLLGAWIAGFDFTERGITALLVYYFTLTAMALAYLFPSQE